MTVDREQFDEQFDEITERLAGALNEITRAVTVAGEDLVQLFILTRYGEGPKKPPFAVTATQTGPNDVLVEWEPPTRASVSRDGTDLDDDGSWTDTGEGTYTFGRLIPGHTYTFIVDDGERPAGRAVLTVSEPDPAPTAGDYTGARSGLPFASGLFPMHKAAEVTAFGQYRGTEPDIVTVFPTRTSWQSMLGVWPYDTQRVPAGFYADGGILDVGVPMHPEDSNLAAVVSGDHDSNWQQLARKIEDRAPKSWVRLGWEMNLPGFPGHATPSNKDVWVAAFRRVVGLIREEAPTLRVAWVPNMGAGQTGFANAMDVYPGDEFVDAIGCDSYDWWPGYTTAANIEHHRTKQYGWEWWYAVAQEHGKPFCLPEWGIAPGNPNGGGDNPRFVEFVYEWLRGKNIAYESYFNEAAAYIRCHVGGAHNPKATAEYRRQHELMAAGT